MHIDTHALRFSGFQVFALCHIVGNMHNRCAAYDRVSVSGCTGCCLCTTKTCFGRYINFKQHSWDDVLPANSMQSVMHSRKSPRMCHVTSRKGVLLFCPNCQAHAAAICITTLTERSMQLQSDAAESGRVGLKNPEFSSKCNTDSKHWTICWGQQVWSFSVEGLGCSTPSINRGTG